LDNRSCSVLAAAYYKKSITGLPNRPLSNPDHDSLGWLVHGAANSPAADTETIAELE
jgi:hypothetical protein